MGGQNVRVGTVDLHHDCDECFSGCLHGSVGLFDRGSRGPRRQPDNHREAVALRTNGLHDTALFVGVEGCSFAEDSQGDDTCGRKLTKEGDFPA